MKISIEALQAAGYDVNVTRTSITISPTRHSRLLNEEVDEFIEQYDLPPFISAALSNNIANKINTTIMAQVLLSCSNMVESNASVIEEITAT